MKSVLLALLLIVNLLMCPVRCLAHDAEATTGQGSVAAVSECCSRCETTPESNTPEPCDGDCECENCICEGAVLEADAELSAPMAYFGDAQPAYFTLAAGDHRNDFVDRDPALTTRQLLSGRDLRVSHQSWLL